MTAEFGLKWVLRLIALSTLFALVAAVLPQPWLTCFIHRFDPAVPVGLFVTYVFRMLMSAFALIGLFCLLCSMDVHRYRPLIWILSVACLIGTLGGFLALCLAVPPDQRVGFFWIAFVDQAEGLAQSVLLVILLLLIPRRGPVHGRERPLVTTQPGIETHGKPQSDGCR